MARSKTQRGDKEYDLLEKLKHENKKLKKEVTSLRKVIDRMDIERYENLRELVDQQREEEKRKRKERAKEKERQCYQCGKGHMQLHIFDRLDGVFYYRACTLCENRTRMKKYHKDVKE